jgi:hypothetical protein
VSRQAMEGKTAFEAVLQRQTGVRGEKQQSVKGCAAAAWRPIQSAECANLVVWFESVAQLVEHRPFKALVLGSSPSALTIKSITYRQPILRSLQRILRKTHLTD